MEADPLKTTLEVAKELTINHSSIVQNLKQIGVKKLDKWVPRADHKSKKLIFIFSYSVH